MHSFLFPTILLCAAANISPAAASGTPTAPSCMTSCSLCVSAHADREAANAPTSAYIDSNTINKYRGKYALRTPAASNNVATATPYAVQGAERPWFVGPKGGDTRKGSYMSTAALADASVTTKSYCNHCATTGHMPAIGPKGGYTSKPRWQSDSDYLRQSAAQCLEKCQQQ